jgi:hypothetical protein
MANAVTSKTGAVVGTAVTFPIQNSQEAVFVYVDYNKGDGTSATMKVGSIHPGIHGTNEYQHADFVTAVVAAITATLNATGRFRFKIPIANKETKFKVTFTFADGTTQAIACNIHPK